jgi:hypothetical protein
MMTKTPDTEAPVKDAPKPSAADVDAHKLAQRAQKDGGKTFAGQGKEVKK